uniref:Uncharacterized protein n=1 Tax=viral metagenome TaxID=1070528 RepID=A0A6C0D0K3_9ZZZZ
MDGSPGVKGSKAKKSLRMAKVALFTAYVVDKKLCADIVHQVSDEVDKIVKAATEATAANKIRLGYLNWRHERTKLVRTTNVCWDPLR